MVEEEEGSGLLDELIWRLALRMVVVEMSADAWLPPSTQGFQRPLKSVSGLPVIIAVPGSLIRAQSPMPIVSFTF